MNLYSKHTGIGKTFVNSIMTMFKWFRGKKIVIPKYCYFLPVIIIPQMLFVYAIVWTQWTMAKSCKKEEKNKKLSWSNEETTTTNTIDEWKVVNIIESKKSSIKIEQNRWYMYE